MNLSPVSKGCSVAGGTVLIGGSTVAGVTLIGGSKYPKYEYSASNFTRTNADINKPGTVYQRFSQILFVTYTSSWTKSEDAPENIKAEWKKRTKYAIANKNKYQHNLHVYGTTSSPESIKTENNFDTLMSICEEAYTTDTSLKNEKGYWKILDPGAIGSEDKDAKDFWEMAWDLCSAEGPELKEGETTVKPSEWGKN